MRLHDISRYTPTLGSRTASSPTSTGTRSTGWVELLREPATQYVADDLPEPRRPVGAQCVGG